MKMNIIKYFVNHMHHYYAKYIMTHVVRVVHSALSSNTPFIWHYADALSYADVIYSCLLLFITYIEEHISNTWELCQL